MTIGLIALAAGLAIGLSALATAWAQARIGAAAVGAILEKPESLVIFGFTVAILILTTLK